MGSRLTHRLNSYHLQGRHIAPNYENVIQHPEMSLAMNANGYIAAAEKKDHEAMEIELRRIIGGQSFLVKVGRADV